MTIIMLIITLIDLCISVILKHMNNQLSFSDFNLFYIGNIISSLPSLILIAGISFSFWKPKNRLKDFRYTIYLMLILISLSYLILFSIKGLSINENNYLLGFPLLKLLNALFYTIIKLSTIYLMIITWLSLFSRRNMIRVRSLIGTLGVISILIVFAYIFNLRFETDETINGKKNYAVVFGAAVWSGDKPSPIFKGRIDKAFELYSSGEVSSIQVTGGHAPGELSEAKTARNRLVRLGVKINDIMVEDRTSNTNEQVRFLKKRLTELNNEFDELILISDSFHLPRILTICDFLNISAKPRASGYKLKWEKLLYYRFRESLALLLFWNFGI
jgi:vancomycin permeability regulator SanA